MTHKCHAQLHFTPYLWHVRSGPSESLWKWIWALPICARNASTPDLLWKGTSAAKLLKAFIQKVKHRNISAAQQLDVCSESLLRFTSVKNINEWGRCSCWAVRWCLYIYSRHTYIYIFLVHIKKTACLSCSQRLSKFEQMCQNMRNCSK